MKILIINTCDIQGGAIPGDIPSSSGCNYNVRQLWLNPHKKRSSILSFQNIGQRPECTGVSIQNELMV